MTPNERTVIELLAEHPFTADLSAEQRQGLAKLAAIKLYDPDALLIQEGCPATTFFLIVGGLVSIEVFVPGRGPRRLQTVEGGRVVGWSWMLAPNRWEFDARAIEPTIALTLDADRLRKLCDQDCALGQHLTRKLLFVVAERLKAARLQLLDLYGPPKEVPR